MRKMYKQDVTVCCGHCDRRATYKVLRGYRGKRGSPVLRERCGRHDKGELVCVNEWNPPGKEARVGEGTSRAKVLIAFRYFPTC